MQKWIRQWLGLNYLEDRIDNGIIDNQRRHAKTSKQLNVISVALGRVLARDPANVVSEFDPARKAESDRLGKEAIDRLYAEGAARRHTLGES